MSGTLLTNDIEERLGFGGLAGLPAGVVVQFSDAGAAADLVTADITKTVGTGLTFTPSLSGDVTRADVEPLAFTSAPSRDYTDEQATSLGFTESQQLIVAFARDPETALGITPSYVRTITVAHEEQIVFTPRLLRPANGRFFNAAVRNRALSGEELTRHLLGFAPADHAPFSNFLPGDYTYQQALVGIRLSAPLAVDTPAIFDAVMNVDLPDIVEKGQFTTVVTSSPANNGWSAVLFAKDFTQVPSVLVTPLSGSVPVTWETRNVTVDGFEARTLNASTQAPVGGIVLAWTAIGI